MDNHPNRDIDHLNDRTLNKYIQLQARLVARGNMLDTMESHHPLNFENF